MKQQVNSTTNKFKGSGSFASLAFKAALIATLLWQSPVRSATFEVRMEDYFYTDQFTAINVGDTVLWKNYGGEHSASSDTGIFDSDVTAFYDEYTFTFTAPGTYPFHCSLHGSPGDGMYGRIVVSDGSENSPPATPINQSPANNATNQPVAVVLRSGSFSDPDATDFHTASQWVLRFATNGVVAVDSGALTGATNLLSYSPAGLAEGTGYDWQVRYKDGRGAWSSYSTPTRFTTLVSFGEIGVGLRASYFNKTTDFASPNVVTTNSTVDFTWLNSRPNRLITADDFVVRWEGSILPQYTEKYAIQIQYKGRARVWVNNQLLIDEWNGCSLTQTRRALISLVGGQLAAIKVDYTADPACAQATLRWTSPSLPMQVIPTQRLFAHAP